MSIAAIGAILFCGQVVFGIGGEWFWFHLRTKGIIICRDQVKGQCVTQGVSMTLYVVMTTVVSYGSWLMPIWWGFAIFFSHYYFRLFRINWRLHKDHDEDCRFGPRKRKETVKSKVRWVRFAPSPIQIVMPT